MVAIPERRSYSFYQQRHIAFSNRTSNESPSKASLYFCCARILGHSRISGSEELSRSFVKSARILGALSLPCLSGGTMTRPRVEPSRNPVNTCRYPSPVSITATLSPSNPRDPLSESQKVSLPKPELHPLAVRPPIEVFLYGDFQSHI